MKKIIVWFLFFNALSSTLNATNFTVKEIKDSLSYFLMNTELLGKRYQAKDLINDFIRDLRIDKGIEEGMNGIFLFYILASHQNLHFLLVGDDKFEIINMRDPFDINLKKLLLYLAENKNYTKEDVLFYISDFIRIHKHNEKINAMESPIM